MPLLLIILAIILHCVGAHNGACNVWFIVLGMFLGFIFDEDEYAL